MRDIRAFTVPRGSVAFWFLGQNGFIFKTEGGTVVGTDLYLTNSCAATAPPRMDMNRMTPVLIPPEEIDVDLFVCTHNHQDHTDPETIQRLLHKDTMSFIGPHPSCEVFRKLGVEAGRITPIWPDHVVEMGDAKLRGTFALPTDDTDLNHVGYIFEFGHAPRIYMTGDTAECDLLAAAGRHTPAMIMSCINGGFNNLSHDQAARLAAAVHARAAVPCHYDMFPDNAANPHQFEAALKLRAPGVRFLAPAHGEPVVFD